MYGSRRGGDRQDGDAAHAQEAAATYKLATSMFRLYRTVPGRLDLRRKTGSISQGILTVYWLSPLVWIAMFILVKGLPKAEATRLERARAAGDPSDRPRSSRRRR